MKIFKTSNQFVVAITFVCAIVLMIVLLCSANTAEAQEVRFNFDNTDALTIDQTIDGIFGDVDVASCGYLYNFDDSADFIYVKFAGDGYAVFNKYTLEMLEYSPFGELPYEEGNSLQYYAGPTYYLRKNKNQFENIVTGQKMDVTHNETIILAQKTREILYNSGVQHEIASIYADSDNFDLTKFGGNNLNVANDSSVPKIDDNNLIVPDNMSGTYIENAYYFLENPMHGDNYEGGNYGNNNSGTCGPVAAQLLLSYNNYYNDRRIIEDRFLYGYDDTTNTVTNLERNPNHCEDPMSMTSYTLGSRSEDTGANSFYSYVVTSIMEPGQYGASAEEVKVGIDKLLEQKLGEEYSCMKIEWSNNNIVLAAPYHKTITSTIDRGNPIIIETSQEFGGDNHFVVGYGYQQYEYPSGDSYTGYIVHYGWDNRNFVWINALWCSGLISLDIYHNHTYAYLGGKYNEEKCTECGYRRYAYDLSDDSFDEVTIIGYDGTMSGDIWLPGTINGKKVNLGNSLFANRTDITSVTITDGLNSIGANTFQGCTSLQSISLPSSLTSIGNGAFYGCSSLSSITIPKDTEQIGANAFQNCTSLKTLTIADGSTFCIIGNSAFQDCPSLNSIITRRTTAISYNAFLGCSALTNITSAENIVGILNAGFANCTNLKSIELPISLRLGYDAFNGCTSLESVTLDTVMIMDDNVFANCPKLTIYVSENTVDVHKLIQSNCVVVSNCVLGEDYAYVISINTANISNVGGKTINNPTRSGYTFAGWYTTADFSGTQYMDLAAAPSGTLYAKWTENACVAAGTLITLADGRQVPVESLTGNEMLLVWNLFTGKFDVAPILFIDSEAAGMYEVVTLAFSDGTTLKVIDEHALWDFDLNEYVFMRSDAAKYIGHWFNKQTYDSDGNMIYTRVQLVGVTVTEEYTSAWSPVTYGHLCFYVNGMLSMPGATTGLINIFEVEPDTMTIDEEQYLADIEMYGLFTYEEFAALYPVPEEIFDAFGGQYLKVAMGKGLLTEDMISILINRYSEFFV